MKLFRVFYFATFLMLVFASGIFADVKIKARQTVSGQTYENTTYIKGKRSRSERDTGQMKTVDLTQCDMKRSVQMSEMTKTYVINMFNQVTEISNEKVSAPKTDGVVRAGGSVTTTVTNKDTGETKKMFGYVAKHIITTMETVSSPDACSPNNMKMQIDGWYIDAAFALDCDDNKYGNYSSNQKQGCQDKYQMKTVGSSKKGYPVYEKMTMFDDDGKEMTSIITEVVELSQATLDQALFEIPEDYREVKDMSQMYSASSMMNSNSNSDSMNMSNNSSMTNSGTISAIKNQAQSSNASSEVGAKQAGTIRIGLASVKVGAVGDGITSADLAGAIQNSLGEYLKGTKIELVPLGAKLSSAIENEAKQKECDYVLYANASHKKGGGGFGGMFGQTIAQGIGAGLGAAGGTIGNVTGQIAAQSIVSAGAMSAKVKAKDEITLEVKMNQPGDSTAILTKQVKAKAKTSGEDIISPVVEQIAQAIFNSVGK